MPPAMRPCLQLADAERPARHPLLAPLQPFRWSEARSWSGASPTHRLYHMAQGAPKGKSLAHPYHTPSKPQSSFIIILIGFSYSAL